MNAPDTVNTKEPVPFDTNVEFANNETESPLVTTNVGCNIEINFFPPEPLATIAIGCLSEYPPEPSTRTIVALPALFK